MLMLRAAYGCGGGRGGRRDTQLCIIYRAALVHAGAAPSAATTLRCGCNTIDEYSSICGVGRDRVGVLIGVLEMGVICYSYYKYSVWLAGYK
ncbi:unnamed protein product [Tuber melanosporum]|uniref:(Perigord truffle) hypothetical protein n=1 Tax=Tuber melanosporum (strain Mel28) TaxID=656061 RepID=D5GFL4_TUBMM|nr:uncharacterized protein GSTUM_00006972001 [Tuber melanosporum]CAZ83307.1 unnamed protein product [Tuber melanosporum]